MNYCKYHPLERPIWVNENSRQGYCERCVDYSGSLGEEVTAKCFVTKTVLKPYTGRSEEYGFWEKLPEAFAYPLQPNGLVMIVVLTGLAMVSAVAEGVAFYALLGLLSFVLFLMGSLIIKRVAEGDESIPSLSNISQVDTRFGAMFWLIPVVMVAAIVGASYFELISVAVLLFILCAALYPCMAIMLLVHEDPSGISPAAVGDFLKQVGWEYGLLAIFTLLLVSGAFGFYAMLIDEVPLMMLATLMAATICYLSIVLFFAFGAAVNDWQALIGYESNAFRARSRKRQAIDPVEAAVMVFVKEGMFDEARKTLTKAVKTRSSDIRKHELLHKLLLAQNDQETLFDHGEVYLNALEKMGDDAKLYFVYRTLEQIKPGYVPDEPGIRLVLAEQSYQRKNYQEVMDYLTKFHERYPNYPRIPDAYLLVAMSLKHIPGQEAKAQIFVKYIQQKFPTYTGMDRVNALAEK